MTLEDLLKQTEEGDVRSAAKKLAEFLKTQDDTNLSQLTQALQDISRKLDALAELSRSILTRPYPEQKDVVFPDYQKVVMDTPPWYVPPTNPPAPSYEWVPNITNSIRYDGEKTRELLTKILDTLNQPEPEEEPKEEPKTVNTASVRSRRTTQWKRFDNYDLKNIISAGDGVTYFLPDSLIPNSETIRLNGGLPLKNSDYTLSGNKLFFQNGDQSSSQIEVRGQVK